jgi:dipeptidase E
MNPAKRMPTGPQGRFLLSGGGGFLMESHPPLDSLMLALCQRPRPKICFVPTASGDSEEMIERFYDRFGSLPCEPTHLAFFRRIGGASIPPARLAEALPAQDVVFVGGGNTRSMLPVWREWGLPAAMAAANQAGTLLAGMSAGAVCWFDWALSDSVHGPGTVTAIPGVGWIPGGCAAHYRPDDADARSRVVHAAVSAAVPSFIALPDGIAALFDRGRLQRVYRAGEAGTIALWRDGAFESLPAAVEVCSI